MTYRSKKKSSRDGATILVGCLLFIFLMVLFISIVGFALMFFWNLVVPSVFGGPTLELGQAIALAFLLWIIGSFFRSHNSSTSK